VRELENILERAMTLSDSSVLGPEQIMLRQVGNNDIPSGALPDQVDEIERQAIREALEKTRYNRTAAAKLLGLTLRQLRYRIEKLGID
jgi:two-component system response regulator PilR (NtrC family)